MDDISDDFVPHTPADRQHLQRLQRIQKRRERGEDSEELPIDVESDVAKSLRGLMRAQHLFQQVFTEIGSCIRKIKEYERENKHGDVIAAINRLEELVVKSAEIAAALKVEAERE